MSLLWLIRYLQTLTAHAGGSFRWEKKLRKQQSEKNDETYKAPQNDKISDIPITYLVSNPWNIRGSRGAIFVRNKLCVILNASNKQQEILTELQRTYYDGSNS